LNDTAAFSALAGLGTQREVEQEVEKLITDLSNGSEQQVFRVLSSVGSVIENRMSSLSRMASAPSAVQYASTSLMPFGTSDSSGAAQTGAWAQGGLQNA